MRLGYVIITKVKVIVCCDIKMTIDIPIQNYVINLSKIMSAKSSLNMFLNFLQLSIATNIKFSSNKTLKIRNIKRIKIEFLF